MGSFALTDWAGSFSTGENSANSGPLILDDDVEFSAATSLDGAVLTISGLLAEGAIGLSGAALTYGGETIGTLSGGNGTDLVVTLTAAATDAAVEALIASLTYANTSDTPTGSRELTLSMGNTAAGPLFVSAAGTDPLAGLGIESWAARTIRSAGILTNHRSIPTRAWPSPIWTMTGTST